MRQPVEGYQQCLKKIETTMLESSTLGGLGLVLAAVIISATRETFLGNLLQGTSPSQVLFISFLMLVPPLLVARGPGILRKSVSTSELWSIVVLNVTTLCSWSFLLLALKFLEPALVVALSACTGPICFRFVPTPLLRGAPRAVPASRLAEVGIASVVIVAIGLQVIKVTSAKMLGFQVAGILFSLLVSYVGAIGTIESKRLANLGWKSIDVQATRYLAVLPLALFSIWVTEDSIPSKAGLYFYGAVIALAIIAATTLLQEAVKISTPVIVMLGLTCSPLVTMIAQRFDGRNIFSAQNTVVVLAISMFSLVGVLAESQRGKKNAAA